MPTAHLFSKTNPIPLWYRLFLPLIEPITTVIALYQLVFHPLAYLSETTPWAMAAYDSRLDTVFNQVALSMTFTIYIESYLFGWKWADQADLWDSAVRLILFGDLWFNIALFQGNQWKPWWQWHNAPGANGKLLFATAVMGVLGPVTRIAFLARVGFQQRARRLAEARRDH